MSSIHLRAFAKINLGLRVLGKRRDGYHEIRTVYQTLTLHDLLEVALDRDGSGIAVESNDPAVPSGRDNLVYKACDLWRRARRVGGRIRVRLEKRIPAGSGLGGASSDAAVAMLGLERLTGDRLDSAARFRLAARLGSDVPLFLWGGRVLGCGRGEEVYPLWDLPRRTCLVVFPCFSVSTAEAYREVSVAIRSRQAAARSSRAGEAMPTLRRSSRPVGAALPLTRNRRFANIDSFGEWPQLPLEGWGPAENDFEEVVFAKWPELAVLKRQFIRAGAETASLTGSGSAVFALFDSARKLAHASKFVPAGWLKFRARTLPRSEYLRAVASDERRVANERRCHSLLVI